MSNPNGNPKHGHSPDGRPSLTYVSWARMKDRCLNPNNKWFERYHVFWHAPWADFEVFLADMGEKPKGHRIGLDRINGALPYGPGNCRWTTPAQQVRNSSKTKLTEKQVQAIRATGRTRSTRVQAVKYGVSTETINDILRRKTWRDI